MVAPLNAGTIRTSTPHEIYQHLRASLDGSTEGDITSQLISLVESGSVSPSPTFAIWLGIAHSPATLHQALKQDISTEIRRQAIRQLGKCLASARWEEFWVSLGGVPGFLHLFSGFSVLEIKQACRWMACSVRGHDLVAKKERITKLAKALFPSPFLDAPHTTLDERPLAKHYNQLVPHCTDEVLSKLLEGDLDGSYTKLHQRSLLQKHASILRSLALRHIFEGLPFKTEWLSALLSKHPASTTSEKGVSASMGFSIQVLQRLANEESPNLSDAYFMKTLCQPLLKRALKKKVDIARVREIIDLIVGYVERHPNAAKQTSFGTGGFMHLMALCWSRHPALFDHQFKVLLSHNQKGVESIHLGTFEPLMLGVARSRRYALLKLCVKAATDRDLDVVDELREISFHSDLGILNYDLLSQLQPEEALRLFTRIRNTKGDEKLVQRRPSSYQCSVMTHSTTLNGLFGDPDLYQTFLLRWSGYQEAAEELAERCREGRRRIAMSSPNAEQRGFSARAALYHAIASGSLEMYRKTLEWARRFVRDPLTIECLYKSYPEEAHALLSGIPKTIDESTTPTELEKRVKAANEIIKDLFTTVCSALREPSFAVHHWSGTLSLSRAVVDTRMRCASTLKKQLSFSNEQLYDILWRDTLEMLIALEEKALGRGHERLKADSLNGILCVSRSGPVELENEEPSTYRFLDDLAKARDELWRKYRPTVYPAAASLAEPFPRGLPLQHLIAPYILDTPLIEAYAPYIAARVHAAVFLGPTKALTPVPRDCDSLAAIGTFVDHYGIALQMFIPRSAADDEKRQRVERAWAHAVGALSRGRVSPEEAYRYWLGTWQSLNFWPPKPPVDDSCGEWDRIPDVDDPTAVEEWNPVPVARPEIKPRSLDTLTYIDLCKRIADRNEDYPTVHSTLEVSLPAIPGQRPQKDAMWSSSHDPESLILSALLYLDTLTATTARLLSRPYPSEKDVRYPAVYLGEDFLSRMKSDSYTALSTLKSRIKNVPGPLLLQAVENALQSLDATDSQTSQYAELERLAFKLLDLLGKCDRPALASNPIVRNIIQRPDASSWHRRLLNSGFLRRLSACDAHACIAAFADAILAQLENQANAVEAQKAELHAEGLPTRAAQAITGRYDRPRIKTTTVKHLAQLLSNADFVSENYSLEVLSNLLQNASHADIRSAVVSSLLELFKSGPPEQSEKVLTILERMVPIAGNLQERRPVSESEWEEAMNTRKAPDLDDANPGQGPTVLMLLIGFLKQYSGQPLSPRKSAHFGSYVSRIILPVLKELKQQTSKWVTVFLRSQDIDDTAQREFNIPPLPRDQAVLEQVLLAATPHLPVSLLKEYVVYLTFNVAPPPALLALNQRLKTDPASSRSITVEAWLQRYGNRNVAVSPFNLTRLFHHPAQLSGEITPQAVQEQFLKLYTAVLWNDNEEYGLLHQLIAPLWAYTPRTTINKNWGEYCKPIVEAIILYVESIRTRDWQRDPDRRPKVLPDTFPQRMWLLQYAAQYSLEADESEARCKAFATKVTKILDQMTGSLYHSKFAQLKAAMEYLLGEEKLRVALQLGDVSKTRLSWLTMRDRLRVEVAAELIKQYTRKRGEKTELEGTAEQMLDGWSKCESEEVRRLGYAVKMDRNPGFGLFD